MLRKPGGMASKKRSLADDIADLLQEPQVGRQAGEWGRGAKPVPVTRGSGAAAELA